MNFSVKRWFYDNYKGVILFFLSMPPLLVSFISTVHCIGFFGLSNPFVWSLILSGAIEVAALSSLAGITVKISRPSLWIIFFLVTFIQIIGNVYYSFDFIINKINTVNPNWIKNWIDLMQPFFEAGGIEMNDTISMSRWLAYISGGVLPIISLSFLHMLVSYTDSLKENEFNDNNLRSNNQNIKNEDVVENNAVPVKETNNTSELKDVDEKIVTINADINKSENNDAKKTDFGKMIEDKKKKLEEEKHYFIPLLGILFNNGTINKGDVLPTYPEFVKIVNKEQYADSTIKKFLTYCNYLEITSLSNDVRKALVNFNEAKMIMENYLSFNSI